MFDSKMESQNIRRKEAEDEEEESSSGTESLAVLWPSSSSEESKYSDDVNPFHVLGFTQTFIIPSSLTSKSSSNDEYYYRQKIAMNCTAKPCKALTANVRGSMKAAGDNKRRGEQVTTSTTTPTPTTTTASSTAATSTANTTTTTTASTAIASSSSTTIPTTTTMTASSSSSSTTASSLSVPAPSSPFQREDSEGSKSPEMEITVEISETGEPLSLPILSGVEEPAEQEYESRPVSSSLESLLLRETERTSETHKEEEGEERAPAESSIESTFPSSAVDVDSSSPRIEGEGRKLRPRTTTSTVPLLPKPPTCRRARGTSRSATVDGTWTIGDWMEVREEVEFTNFVVNVILSIERELDCGREEATVRFEHSVMFHFDRADPHNTSTHPNGSDIRRRTISSTEEEWGAFLVPVENRSGPRYRLANLEETWVTFYDIDQENMIHYLFYDSARRALEISINYLDYVDNLDLLTETMNTFDHQDERYLCEWISEREEFVEYVASMVDMFMKRLECSREEALACFKSMVLQCFSSENGSFYRRGRELRRDGMKQGSEWWSALLEEDHPSYSNSYPSSILRQIENDEFTGQYREGLYRNEDDFQEDSYRIGRRAIFIATDFIEASMSLQSYLSSGAWERVINRELPLSSSSMVSMTTSSTPSPSEAITTSTTTTLATSTTSTSSVATTEATGLATTTTGMATTTTTEMTATTTIITEPSSL